MAPVAASAQESILADAARSDDERARDAGSKPLEVYAFWGIEAGMTVADLMPGGGYNTFILSNLVGDQGKVYAGPDRRGGLATRLEANPLANVEIIASPGDLPANSLDVAVTVRNVHDLGDNAAGFLAACLAALKPGGVLGVVDARTNMDGYDGDTHRINQQMVIDLATAAGFEFVEASEMLANADDDFGKWEGASGRTNTDRMVLKFRKGM
jgi:predicted methyltransferase